MRDFDIHNQAPQPILIVNDERKSFVKRWLGRYDVYDNTANAISNKFYLIFEATLFHILLCPTNYIPTNSPILDHIAKFSKLNGDLRSLVIHYLGISSIRSDFIPWFLEAAIIGPILEEIVMRGLIQQVVLRYLPKKLLERLSPSYAWTIESKIAKISRVVLTASIFALMHTDSWECSKGGTGSQLLMGLVFGAATEATNSIFNATKLHIAHNAIALGALLLPILKK